MLALNRLGRRDGAALVEQIAGGKALARRGHRRDRRAHRRRAAVRRGADQGGAESGCCARRRIATCSTARCRRSAIPATLARLADGAARPARRRCKEVAQIGAAIGREFSYELLQRRLPNSPKTSCRPRSHRLVDAELVFQRGTPPDAVYMLQARAGAGRGLRHPAARRRGSNCTRRSPKRSKPIPPS